MYLDIAYIWMDSKSYVPRETKTTYNLESMHVRDHCNPSSEQPMHGTDHPSGSIRLLACLVVQLTFFHAQHSKTMCPQCLTGT